MLIWGPFVGYKLPIAIGTLTSVADGNCCTKPRHLSVLVLFVFSFHACCLRRSVDSRHSYKPVLVRSRSFWIIL